MYSEIAPQGTFQDELEWCISQLETGLLRLNPTPEQAQESRHVLRVLRSRKAPLVKKRQVMHQVFGDYRHKMAEEMKRAAKAAVKSEKVQIQPGDVSASGCRVYRKQSGQPSEPSSWFAPSDNSFQFGFVLPERTLEEINQTAEEANGVDNSQEQLGSNSPSLPEGQREALRFSAGTQGPEFAFNFVIPDALPPPGTDAGPGLERVTEAGRKEDTQSRKASEMSESVVSPKPDRLDAVSPDDDGSLLEATQKAIMEKKESNATGASAGGSSKRKKRKKRHSSKAEPMKNINRDSRLHIEDASDPTEMCQPSDEQLKREVDWCVEQLELGLKTQKSTPRQADEAFRAIKTLRSEKAALAKKRQIMRLMFGDYRKKMAEERQKQLKLMKAASKTAQISQVTEDAHRKSSRVYRKSAEASGRSQSPTESLLHHPSSASFPRRADACSFTFTPSQEEFRFNFL